MIVLDERLVCSCEEKRKESKSEIEIVEGTSSCFYDEANGAKGRGMALAEQ